MVFAARHARHLNTALVCQSKNPGPKGSGHRSKGSGAKDQGNIAAHRRRDDGEGSWSCAGAPTSEPVKWVSEMAKDPVVPLAPETQVLSRLPPKFRGTTWAGSPARRRR